MFVNSYYTAMYRIYLLLFLLLGGRSHQAGSLVLTSSPMTATDGELFTLICSSNTTGGQDRQWNRDDTIVFSTTQGSHSPTVANNYIFNRYLSGRVNVSCDATQHNVTLRINSAVDNGTRWYCADYFDSQTSNTMAIYVTEPQSTVTATPTHSTPTATDIAGSTDIRNLMPSTTTTAATTTTTADTTTTTATATSPMSDVPSSTLLQGGGKTSSDVVSIAVGAAVGGVVVGCVLTVVVVAVWMRRRHRNAEASTSPPNIYTCPSHYEDMEHQYGQVERQYVNSVEGMKTDSPHAVNADTQPRDADYYNTVGQQQHLNEDANKGETTYNNTARDADN